MPIDTINDFHDEDDRCRPDGDPGGFPFKKQRLNMVNTEMAREAVAAEAAEPTHGWNDRGVYLVRTMRRHGFILDSTPFAVVDWLAKAADKIYVYAGYGKAGEASILLKRLNVGHIGIDAVLRASYAELANEHERENKDVFWIFASAFIICFYEVKARKPFTLQYHHPQKLVTEFKNLYPEFAALDSGLVFRFLTYHLVMQVVVSAFGGADPNCLIELVTRMTEGREVALAMNKPASLLFSQKVSEQLGNINDCRRIVFQRVYDVKRAAAKEKEKKKEEVEKLEKEKMDVEKRERIGLEEMEKLAIGNSDVSIVEVSKEIKVTKRGREVAGGEDVSNAAIDGYDDITSI